MRSNNVIVFMAKQVENQDQTVYWGLKFVRLPKIKTRVITKSILRKIVNLVQHDFLENITSFSIEKSWEMALHL